MIRIRSDELLFIVSSETIGKFPESDIYKIINGQSIKNNYIHKDEKDGSITLYIDSDPEIMKTIVKIMRGANINLDTHSDSDLLKTTLKKLNFHLRLPEQKSYDVNSDSVVDTMTLGIGSDTQNKISTLIGGSTQFNLSEDLSQFSSDVARNLDESIHKKLKKTLRAKFLKINENDD